MADRWYVVASNHSNLDPDRQIWTVSRNPNLPGWETDMGCDGYGLTKAEADFLAQAANEKSARESSPPIKDAWTIKDRSFR